MDENFMVFCFVFFPKKKWFIFVSQRICVLNFLLDALKKDSPFFDLGHGDTKQIAPSIGCLQWFQRWFAHRVPWH